MDEKMKGVINIVKIIYLLFFNTPYLIFLLKTYIIYLIKLLFRTN